MMWINGGPGGSSAMGLFMEQGKFSSFSPKKLLTDGLGYVDDGIGPCRVKEDPKTVNDTYPNKYAWNQRVSVVFTGRCASQVMLIGPGECVLLGSADRSWIQSWRAMWTGEIAYT